ncbi:MAG: aspartate aminotransferase family protein [Ruminococcus sp.]|nr:aspartate aminotransferase family protein [Ruminococcus sp.]MBP8594489.1 aspartate aminotransferase family protein [Ruminococcus sp.]MBQ3855522.1 aspartate aminotransferase family protein [Ruminococcus sp.]MBQ8122615.1 aspartate aminotransferase family protein [Ruminococcus sp.]HBB20352.1 aspartate aminotransferase family protein [Ruminococcus sp.]
MSTTTATTTSTQTASPENAELKKYLFRGEYDIHDLTFDRCEGIYLWDTDGRRYIDTAAGTFNLSLGYTNKEVVETAKEQCDKMIHLSSSYFNENVLQLAKKLVEVSPENLTRAHLKVSGGSTANEGAVKLSQYYTGKREVISYYMSHVGQTIFMQEASGLSFRRSKFDFGIGGISHVQYPYCYRCPYGHGNCENCGLECLNELKNYIAYGSSGDIACLIIEPIQGNGGNQVPPKAYFKELKKICDDNGIVLIFDEIQTGVGRTGKMYAAQYFDVQPNIITTAKGLGGTGFQIAGILMEEKFNRMESFLHSFTYGTNILSVTAALKTLSIIDDPKFLNNVTVCGQYIMDRLRKMQDKYEFIGDVRGVGLMIGFEIVKDRKTKKADRELTLQIVHRALDQYGLMLRSSLYGFGNVLKIRPALNITMDQCEEMMDILEECLDSFDH